MTSTPTPKFEEGNLELPKAIAAMARNRVIGHNGTLPWDVPEDLAFLRRTTKGHDLLMGRRTWEALGGKPLPDRRHYVLSTSMEPTEGATIIQSLEDLPAARGDTKKPLWVFGGAEIYKMLLPNCSDLFLTVIDQEPEGDTFFPEFETSYKLVKTLEAGEGYTIYHYVNFQPQPLPWVAAANSASL